MDAKKFFDVLVSSLEREEKELKNIQEDCGDGKATSISVRSYYEIWISYLVYKEMIREGLVEEIDFEKEKVDFCLLDSDSKPSVAIELKGPFDVNENAEVAGYWIKEIQSDVSKQAKRNKLPNCKGRYVVLLPWGDKEMVEKWMKGQLVSDIFPRLSDGSVSECSSKQLALNNGTTMKVVMYEVSPLN